MKIDNSYTVGQTGDGKYLLVISLILLAATMDWPSIYMGGATLRLSWLILPFLFAFFLKSLRLNKPIFMFCLAFIVLSVPSFYFSLAPSKSLFYVFWILFNYFVFFSVFYTAAMRLGNSVFKPILWVSRFHIVFGAFLFFADIQERPASFFYEPSYLSIALIPYIVAICFNLKFVRKYDYILLVFYAIASQSAAFFLCLFSVLCVLVVRYFFAARNSVKSMLSAILMVIIFSVVGIGYVYTVDDLNTVIIRAIIENASIENLQMVLMRGGNRFPRMVEAYDAISKNFFSGVGLGAYENYSLIKPVSNPEYAEGYLSGEGQPAVNIWLEVFATAGVASFVCFVALTVYFSKRVFSASLQYKWALIAVIFSIFSVMNFESNYMRAYLWCYLGMVLGMVNLFSSKNFVQFIPESK